MYILQSVFKIYSYSCHLQYFMIQLFSFLYQMKNKSNFVKFQYMALAQQCFNDLSLAVSSYSMHMYACLVTVSTLFMYIQCLSNGWMNRTVGATSMNRESSRSHAVFTIYIESKVSAIFIFCQATNIQRYSELF